MSNDPTIVVTMEDLQISPFALGGDATYGEEAFEVRGQFGIPRPRLGVLVMRRDSRTGKTFVHVEEHDE